MAGGREAGAAGNGRSCDVLILGSGIAGLATALNIDRSLRVTILTKRSISDTTTFWAQGGIAAAIGVGDSPRLHFEDTVETGEGLCDAEAVRILVTEGPRRIEELVTLGTPFDLVEGILSLGLEGAHSKPRIVHAGGDKTGSEVGAALIAEIGKRENVEVIEDLLAVDLAVHEGTCSGALCCDPQGRVSFFKARAVILATGGCGQVFRETTNPPVATGDGVAMAWRCGCAIRDMEFIQFHPTALDTQGSPKFLITEALRGEGAKMLDAEGERFMEDAEPMAELSSRSTLVREMVKAAKRTGKRRIYIDAREIPEEKLKARFPTVWERCSQLGLRLSRDLVPVWPAAHYSVGGVITDLEGRTDMPGLYACGEAASTGVHGANRLASNSLLEGLVFGYRIAECVNGGLGQMLDAAPPESPLLQGKGGRSPVGLMDDMKVAMSRDVGIERCRGGLLKTEELLNEMEGECAGMAFTVGKVELSNMITAAGLITAGALARCESRGAHYRADHPETEPSQRGHYVFRRGVETDFQPVQ